MSDLGIEYKTNDESITFSGMDTDNEFSIQVLTPDSHHSFWLTKSQVSDVIKLWQSELDKTT